MQFSFFKAGYVKFDAKKNTLIITIHLYSLAFKIAILNKPSEVWKINE